MTGMVESIEPSGWRALVWRAYEHLPSSADGPLRVATRAAIPVTKRHVPLALWHGTASDGRPARVLVAGDSRLADDVAGTAFGGTPTVTALGAVPLWRLRGELARRRAGVDLVVARLDRLSAALALDPGWLAVPEWVGGSAPVPDDPWRFCGRNNSLQANAVRARRAGFVGEVSHDLDDFPAFYERMYVPFVARRHGAAVMVSNRSRLRRCFRQGALVYVVQNGVRVAGGIVRHRGAVLDLVVLGTAGGDLGALTSGAIFALDVFAFEHARTLGCTHLDFGGSRPSPVDGLLIYKARWGADVVDSRSTFYDVHLWWPRLGRPVLDVLARRPLIVRDADGLSALWADQPSARPLRDARSVLTRLRRLYLLGATPGTLAEAERIGIATVPVDAGDSGALRLAERRARGRAD